MKRFSKLLILLVIAVFAIAAVVLFIQFTQRKTENPFKSFSEIHLGENEVGVLFLGESAFVLKTVRHTIIIDPASKISRDDAKILGKVDAILITHEHSDHFASGATLNLYQEFNCPVIVNKGAYESLKNLISEGGKLILIDPGETLILDGVIVEAIEADHPANSPLMYIITLDNMTILHASDSGFVQSLERFSGRIDLALLPIGSPSPSASPSDALEMVMAVMPKKIIMMHGSASEFSEFKDLIEDSGLNTVIEEVETAKPRKISL
ncbi:MAG: MBL fold metallo-hydrolase [Candidatus Bathyarchaeia archaeon]|nr:MBL fold metallo-hydrolase [Candidatus Bathyarchaeota archaeon]